MSQFERVSIPKEADEPSAEDEFVDPPQQHELKVPRTKRGQPRIFPVEGGKTRAYTRATTFIGCLEDQYQIHLWQQRMTALGLAKRPDLILSVSANQDDRDALNEIVEKARWAAGATEKADSGTAIHSLTERVDLGDIVLSSDHPNYLDLVAYQKAMRHFNVVSMEQFCVLDKWGGIGGTPDRVLEFLGKYHIGDVKTGSIERSALKHSMQMAVYANSVPYFYEFAPDPDSKIGPDDAAKLRGRWPGDIDLNRAILIHLPKGEGRCDVYWLDISEGWMAVQIAAAVRGWRNKKNLMEPFDLELELARHKVDNATSYDELKEVYSQFAVAATDEQKAKLVEDCKRRKSDIMHKEAHEEFVKGKARNGRY